MVGVGASIGSVPPHANHNCVRNVSFVNISMPRTAKGIYVKSNPQCEAGSTAEITNILYVHTVPPPGSQLASSLLSLCSLFALSLFSLYSLSPPSHICAHTPRITKRKCVMPYAAHKPPAHAFSPTRNALSQHAP